MNPYFNPPVAKDYKENSAYEGKKREKSPGSGGKISQATLLQKKERGLEGSLISASIITK